MAVLPLRDRLQAVLNRLLYGGRRKPYEALRRLADRVHDASSVETVMGELAATVAASLRVPSCTSRWRARRRGRHAATAG